MTYDISTREKKHRHKDEDWKWFEDPYKTVASSIGWTQEILESNGSSVPAPHPKFGTEPPVHTGARII